MVLQRVLLNSIVMLRQHVSAIVLAGVSQGRSFRAACGGLVGQQSFCICLWLRFLSHDELFVGSVVLLLDVWRRRLRAFCIVFLLALLVSECVGGRLGG